MNQLEFLQFSLIDVIDVVLVAVMLYYLYKLLRGTVAINIFLGIVIIYLIWVITDALNMDVLSNILGNFISVGFFALIVVFQQEIRKFLLLLGSTNYTRGNRFARFFSFLNADGDQNTGLDTQTLIASCKRMAETKTGAIIVFERSNTLDFLKSTGDETRILISPQILETIFFKDNPLHDGAVIVSGNYIKATRVVLPVSESTSLPKRFGLRHKAAVGITEKTDALAIVVSEQRGEVIYVKDGKLEKFKSLTELEHHLTKDLSL